MLLNRRLPVLHAMVSAFRGLSRNCRADECRNGFDEERRFLVDIRLRSEQQNESAEDGSTMRERDCKRRGAAERRDFTGVVQPKSIHAHIGEAQGPALFDGARRNAIDGVANRSRIRWPAETVLGDDFEVLSSKNRNAGPRGSWTEEMIECVGE
jgi:hypothetical protein